MSDKDADINSIYKEQVGFHPLLSAEEELALAERIQAGDTAALNKLVNCNLRLVMHASSRYIHTVKRFTGITMDDLIQEGNIGLMTAAQKFDSSFGVRFSTYAMHHIRSNMVNLMKRRGRGVRLPDYIVVLMNHFERVEEELLQKYHRPPTDREVAEVMGIDIAQVQKVRKYAHVAGERDFRALKDTENTEIWDIIPDRKNSGIENAAERVVLRDKLMSAVAGKLNEQEQYIINERVGYNADQTPRTLQEIGDTLGLTRERIRQKEDKLLKKLRWRLDFDKLGYGEEVALRQNDSLADKGN